MTLTSNPHWAYIYIKKHVTLWTNFFDFFFHDIQLLSFLALSWFVVMLAEYIFSVCFQYICFSLFSICCNNACSLFYMYICLQTVNSLIVMKRILNVISNTKCQIDLFSFWYPSLDQQTEIHTALQIPRRSTRGPECPSWFCQGKDRPTGGQNRPLTLPLLQPCKDPPGTNRLDHKS